MQPKKNAFVGLWEKFQAFLKTPAGLPIVVCVAGVALVGAAVAVTVAARGGDSLPGSVSTSWSEPEDDKTYDAEAGKVNKEEFTGIILPVTEDAGQEYLDETLFIGDSNTARYMYYGPDDDSDVHFTTIENTVGVVSAGVQNITSLKWEHFVGKGDMAIPEIVQIMQPQRIIICFGTNNLTMETDTFIDYYTKGLAAIEEAWPHADIIVSAIPPLDKERSNTNLSMKQVDRLNTAIVEMCEAEGYKYLDTSEALEDPDTGWAKDGYTLDLDGVHLSKNGARALFEYIRTHAYITEDTRPKPLKDIPKINGVTPGLITQDPIGVSGSSLVPVEISASEGGHIVGETSQSVKKGQQTSMITAVADDGWEFSHWSASIGFVDQQESIMFTVPGNADANGVFLTAHFRRVEEEPDPTPSPTPSPSPSPSPNPTSKPSSTSTPATSTPATSTPATSTPATSTPATSTPSTAQPEPTPCPHDYKETSSTPATCEAAGSRTFTCSLCGNSYTEPIQAPGHNYVDGVCAVCGAKDPNYTEPAPAPDNTQTEGGDEVDGAQNVTNVPPAEEQPADNGGGDVT
ncbi:MAG TPA: hypothetical protein H9795_03020 [Candidatus Fournierella merdigallinarum]|nr:hypothetical protein [Candidatus Fournierella merdigallinarum]